jgi:outer membrane protein OmpA-like peptidoglycan-associated protein
MMRRASAATLAILLCGVPLWLFLTGCAAQPRGQGSLVVLLADPDGHVGQIDVSNQGGVQRLTTSREATTIRNATTPPTPPAPLTEAEIDRIFGKVLAAQPEPPVTYILYFKTGSSDLTEASAKQLPEIFATVRQRQPSDITVVGHTDTVGTRQKNHELARERAQRVKDLLGKAGIDPRDIEVDSHGKDNLLVKTPDSVAEPRNRRVEVTIR